MEGQRSLNLEELEKYARQFASRKCEDFYANKSVISGQEILKLTPVKQINMFVVRHLFQAWHKEKQKLKSPYFDYEHEEVKKAFKHFANKLSRHIAIQWEDFEPLLEEAVKDTIILLLAPSHYYREIFWEDKEDFITHGTLKEEIKYHVLNNFFITAVKEKMERDNINEIPYDQFCEIIEEQERNYPDFLVAPDEYEAAFSEVLPVEFSSLVQTQEEKAQSYMPSREEVSGEAVEEGHSRSLNERFTTPVSTLNEKLSQEEVRTENLAEKHQKTKVEQISKIIPLHQKFIFINELFNKDMEQYETAIKRLDNCTSFEEAQNILEEELAPEYQWDMEKDEVKELFHLVKRKFSD